MGSSTRTLTLSDPSRQLFFKIGLLFIGAGVLCNQWVVLKVAPWLGNLAGWMVSFNPADILRIWIIDIAFILIGLTLVLIRYRSNDHLRKLSDIFLGLFFTVLLLIFLEGFFLALNGSRYTTENHLYYVDRRNGSPAYIFQNDSLLGYKLLPNLHITATETTQAGLELYTATYTTDEYGRRVTPVEDVEQRIEFLLFFADSYSFGYGVSDDETFPFYVAQGAPGYQPYNYGVSGYGPQQMLARLQDHEIAQEISEKQGLLIYLFLDTHVQRAIGSMRVHNNFGPIMPYYTLDGNNEVVAKGTLMSGRPLLSLVYHLLSASQTVNYLAVDIPRLNDHHYYLTARIIDEARHTFKDKFASDEFYVLIYPGQESRIIPHLEKSGVKYLDYSTLFNALEGMSIPGEGHPTGKAYKKVAEQLVKDLHLDSSIKKP